MDIVKYEFKWEKNLYIDYIICEINKNYLYLIKYNDWFGVLI